MVPPIGPVRVLGHISWLCQGTSGGFPTMVRVIQLLLLYCLIISGATLAMTALVAWLQVVRFKKVDSIKEVESSWFKQGISLLWLVPQYTSTYGTPIAKQKTWAWFLDVQYHHNVVTVCNQRLSINDLTQATALPSKGTLQYLVILVKWELQLLLDFTVSPLCSVQITLLILASKSWDSWGDFGQLLKFSPVKPR